MDHPPIVTWTAASRRTDALALAERLALAWSEADALPDTGLALVFTPQRLELRALGAGAPGPVAVDFVSGQAAQRQRRSGIRNEALARAAGLGQGYRPQVIDATAGLGRDAFLLAALGCDVLACERNPVIAALLADGLGRARRDPDSAPIAERIDLVTEDARDVLAARQADVVLVDPMHPPRGKAAAVKKEMQLLQRLLGPDDAGAELLAVAIAAARRRVVVKRPRRAPPLGENRPVDAVTGRSTRFDIYRGTAADRLP